MSNRRFEMVQYRQVLVRMRLGESDRQIAAAGLMGGTSQRRIYARKPTRKVGWI